MVFVEDSRAGFLIGRAGFKRKEEINRGMGDHELIWTIALIR
jgi:hypothetical protein